VNKKHTYKNDIRNTETLPYAQDVYGYSLHYFKNDYRAVGYVPETVSVLGVAKTGPSPLFTGNIAAMAVNIPKLGTIKVYDYTYDQLNRLVEMDAYDQLDINNGTYVALPISDYRERISYDANGNMRRYFRWTTGAELFLNDYIYTYTANTNRLASFHNTYINSSPSGNASYSGDGSYSYDAIGNVIKDTKQNVNLANWNVYGKLQSVTKTDGSIVNYAYNSTGHRN
jgi:hypothetical protein